MLLKICYPTIYNRESSAIHLIVRASTFPYIYFYNLFNRKGRQDDENARIFTFIYVFNMWENGHLCLHNFFNALYSDEKLFLLKKSQLTSLFIQHNQSPDTSIFTLYSNNGSKVEKELERKERKINQ